MMIFSGLFLAACVCLVVFALYNGIGPMPTSERVKTALLQHLENLKGPIVELGAGFGTLALPLAKKFPLEKIIAYENSWIPYFFLKIRSMNYPRLVVQRQDFWEADLSESGVVVCYLYTKAMERLKIKLANELKPGTLVVSHTFAIPGWQPIAEWQADDLYKTPIYHYIMGKT